MSDFEQEGDLAPVPETRTAFDWLSTHGSEAIEQTMERMAREVRRVAPDCTAMSLSVSHVEMTFTVRVYPPGSPVHDDMQYPDGGPCLEAIGNPETVATTGGATDEE